MTVFRMILVLCVLATMCRAAGEDGAAAKAADTNRVAALIKQLAAGDFKTRSAAEKELAACPRSVVPVLRAWENTDAPELQVSIRNIIRAILTDPNRIATAYYVFDTGSGDLSARKTKWAASAEEWRGKATVAVAFTNGRSSTAGSFAQSFVPHCNEIQTVELGVYPASFDQGWTRLDVREDEEGRPAPLVLARCWILFDKECPVLHGQWTPFAFPDLTVDPARKYWLCYSEYPTGEHRAIVNYKLNMEQDGYAEGGLWRASNSSPSAQEDALFRVLSNGGPPPGLRAATDEERKSLPKVDPGEQPECVGTTGLPE